MLDNNRCQSVNIYRWARGWYLVGNGPSYLLFRAEEKRPEARVLHLTMELPRSGRAALKGFRVIEDGKLIPPVPALRLINTALLFSPRSHEDVIRCRKASLEILGLIELMLAPSSEQTFKARLSRFNSYIKAAHCLTTFEI
jgi:hypothetical protein